MMAEGTKAISSPLDWFEASVRGAAVSSNLSVEPAPHLVSKFFRGGEKTQSATLGVSDLPGEARALKIGRYAVVLGVLPEIASAEVVLESLRRYRNQCVVARSFLTPNEALDLQLFLVGPRGSEPLDNWQPLALAIERDERVSRKLAWLRPVDPTADKASFENFLKRTFLARPWQHQAVFHMAALDNLGRGINVDGVPRDTFGEWVQLAITKVGDPTDLVDGLVESWSKRGKS